jgi:flagellar motility protein MotE (MotC chaperone)
MVEFPARSRTMDQRALQRSLKNVSRDDPRVRRIEEIDAKADASEEEREEMLRLILLLKKELPSK